MWPFVQLCVIPNYWNKKLFHECIFFYYLICDTFQFDCTFFNSLQIPFARFHSICSDFYSVHMIKTLMPVSHVIRKYEFCMRLLNVTDCWAWEKCTHENYTKKSERVIQIKQAVTDNFLTFFILSNRIQTQWSTSLSFIFFCFCLFAVFAFAHRRNGSGNFLSASNDSANFFEENRQNMEQIFHKLEMWFAWKQHVDMLYNSFVVSIFRCLCHFCGCALHPIRANGMNWVEWVSFSLPTHWQHTKNTQQINQLICK